MWKCSTSFFAWTTLAVSVLAQSPPCLEPNCPPLVDPDRCLEEAADRILPLPYRARYNRPTFIGGMMAHMVSPTSQEGMEWQEHVQRGTYRKLHAPPVCDKYYYPKPWELIPIGPRDCRGKGQQAEFPAGPDLETDGEPTALPEPVLEEIPSSIKRSPLN